MPKIHLIISQHLERVSGRLLEEFQSQVRTYFERQHGVYALYKDGRLYYVGLASDLSRRLKRHLDDRHRGLWNEFSAYLTFEHGHLRELEALLLRINRPKGNRTRGRLGNSKDLRREFRRDVREHMGLQLRELFKRWQGRTPARKGQKGKVRLAHLVSGAFDIVAKSKGRTYRARVLKDGMIKMGARRFRSPSGAGKAAIGRNVDGYTFWKFQGKGGRWVYLDELRRGRRS